MKNILIPFIALTPLFGFSQNLHGDIFAGIATYQGDLQGKSFNINQSKPAVGLGLSYDLSDKFIVRTGFTYGTVEGDDKKNTTAKGIAERNLNFKSAIIELHAGLEFNLFDLQERSFTPYVFAGVAGFHFNPYTKDVAGNKVFLQPLSTEGQGLTAYPDRKEYKLTQFSIPFGGGIKIKLSDDLQVGLELGIRKLFTDYLDDVSDVYADKNILFNAKGAKAVELAFRGNEINANANYPAAGEQRGNVKTKDYYYFSGIKISKRLNSIGGYGGGKTGCPKSVF